MLTFQEIKDAIEKLSIEPNKKAGVKDEYSTEEIQTIRQVALQLGYSLPDAGCKCKNQWRDLVIKLKLWSRQHPEECHYQMKRGIIRVHSDGTNTYALNLTDERAEYLLKTDPNAYTYITKIAETDKVEVKTKAKSSPKKTSSKKKKTTETKSEQSENIVDIVKE